MKSVLICGAGSFIGTAVASHLGAHPSGYRVDTLDMMGTAWKTYGFAGYDAILYVAGIAHISTKKFSKEQKTGYWRVNAELPVEAAEIAKKAGVKQFIFLSSMSVYGKTGLVGAPCVIGRDTPTDPKDIYGESKLAAEKGLLALGGDAFAVCVLRPPMVYGRGSRGNYPTLSKAAMRLPLFPDYDNRRSMLYVGNLCAFVKLLIDNNDRGIFWPQNSEYVKTSDLVSQIARARGRNIRLTRLFNPFVRLLSGVPAVKKVFGNLTYDQALSAYPHANYQAASFAQSVAESERA